ncbi:MAG: hypothetical protein ACR2OV_00300 [Hyphomicrobiaceae bacterium]
MSREREKRWAVVKVTAGRESCAAKRLKKLGLEYFCPDDGPDLTGYVPVEPAIIEAPEKRDELSEFSWFHGFIRDINYKLATFPDEQLDPLRLLEREECERPKYVSGPQFYVGEVRKIPTNNPHVDKVWWDMTGRIIKKRARGGYWVYCMNGHDFNMKKWFTGLQLLGQSV